MFDPVSEWNDQFVRDALADLYRLDPHLLRIKMERSLSGKFAIRLQSILEHDYLKRCPDVRVDVEYNREGGADKVKRNSSDSLVRPDVIVHVPDDPNDPDRGKNVAVFEFKGWWHNPVEVAADRLKLADFGREQGYEFCYQIVIEPQTPTVRRVRKFAEDTAAVAALDGLVRMVRV
jgi:hypothetical protein